MTQRTLELRTRSEEETILLGRALGQLLKPGDVIYLIGDLGSGKTRLAKGIVAAAAGVDPNDVVSPTFTLINCYQGEQLVFHADLYRLDPGCIDDIGLDDTLEAGGSLIVEWAERMPEFSADPLTLVITWCGDENCRKFVLEWREDGTWNDRVGPWLALGGGYFPTAQPEQTGCSTEPILELVGE